MRSKKRNLSKQDFLAYLKQLYESRDIAESDTATFSWILSTIKENKTGRVSLRSLKSYKQKYQWSKGKLASGQILEQAVKEVKKSRRKAKTQNEPEALAVHEIVPEEVLSPEQLKEFEHWASVSHETRQDLVRSIGERYMETGYLPYNICKEVNLPYGLFVRWTTEYRDLELTWKMYRDQRTLLVCEALKGYMVNIAEQYIKRAFSDKVTVTKKWVTTGIDEAGELTGVWVNDTLKIEPPMVPSPNDMAGLLQVVASQEAELRRANDDARDTGSLDLDEAIKQKEEQLKKLREE